MATNQEMATYSIRHSVERHFKNIGTFNRTLITKLHCKLIDECATFAHYLLLCSLKRPQHTFVVVLIGAAQKWRCGRGPEAAPPPPFVGSGDGPGGLVLPPNMREDYFIIHISASYYFLILHSFFIGPCISKMVWYHRFCQYVMCMIMLPIMKIQFTRATDQLE